MNETRFQSWVKIGTAVATALTAGSLLLHDWGPGNCFSPIRPAIKGYFNQVFGVHTVERAANRAKPQKDSQFSTSSEEDKLNT